MLMTLAATVTATVILIPLPTWKRFVVLASALPIALVSNIIRIVATGWCYHLIQGERPKKFAHDWSGYLMMPLALVLVGVEVLVLSWLAADSEAAAEAAAGCSSADRSGPSQDKQGQGQDKVLQRRHLRTL